MPTLAAASRIGQPIFHTYLYGDVQISTDGHKLWIKTQRDGE